MSQTSFAFFWLKLLLKLFMAMIAFVFIVILAFPIGFYGMAMYIEPNLPSISELKQSQPAMPLQIYTQDDQLIGQYGNTMSLPVSYEEIPKNLVNAFLAAEDTSFFQHTGVSVKGIGRALTEAISEHEEQTGGSTITMQVAKNYFLSPERTINRKLTEIFLARRIEEQLTKDEIFTLYVNKIYLGQGAYGIKAAAKRYYSKSLDNLTIAEMAMIAGLPKAPSRDNPVLNPKRALERRNWILGQMLKHNTISQVQYDEAIHAPINLNLYQAKLDKNFPYLAEMARTSLVERYGERVMDSGWRVRLTIHSKSQEIAERAVQRGLFAYDRRHGWRGAEAHNEDLAKFQPYDSLYPAKVTAVSGGGFTAILQDHQKIQVPRSGMNWASIHHQGENATYVSSHIIKVNDIVYVHQNSDKTSWNLVQIPKIEGSLASINPENGAIIAAVGGFHFNKSKFNRAIQGYRQPGSTIKPLIYAAALEKGFQPDTMVSDGPLKVGNWTPKNADGRFGGMMPLRRGLSLSRNLVSIRVLRYVGTPDARALLDQMGLNKNQLPTTLSLALGAGEATPMQMATAYATFANGGHRVQPYFIEQIYDYNNKLLYQASPAQACASCFNQQLDKLNAKMLKDHQSQQKNKHKTTAQIVQDDLLNEDPLAENKKPNLKKTQKSNQDQRFAEIAAQLYDANPETDRLNAPAIQYTTAQQAPRVISASTAYEMANMLREVIQHGTATKARALGRNDLGGKTGTTNEAKDAWFGGIHPTMATVVWIGFDQPKPMGRREFGGVAALPVWMDFTGKMLKDVPQEWVSLNNDAKSEKQTQETIEITDNGTKRINHNQKKDKEQPQDSKQPPKAFTQKRPEERRPSTPVNEAQITHNSPITPPMETQHTE